MPKPRKFVVRPANKPISGFEAFAENPKGPALKRKQRIQALLEFQKSVVNARNREKKIAAIKHFKLHYQSNEALEKFFDQARNASVFSTKSKPRAFKKRNLANKALVDLLRAIGGVKFPNSPKNIMEWRQKWGSQLSELRPFIQAELEGIERTKHDAETFGKIKQIISE